VWPESKRFAFTIFDDTDLETVDNGPGVYAFLSELGMRVTKSVWVLPPTGVALYGGSSCAESDYLAWTHELQQAGHEIALHNVASSTSTRAQTLTGFDRFRDLFGHDPRTLANHVGNLEAIYHGEERVTGARRAIYNVLTRGTRRRRFVGQVPESPLFWGDLCAERVPYVRNFVFRGTDTLAACPYMPYHDSAKPYVTAWFAASEGANPASFARTIGEAEQDRLEAGGGLCIMYTHRILARWRARSAVRAAVEKTRDARWLVRPGRRGSRSPAPAQGGHGSGRRAATRTRVALATRQSPRALDVVTGGSQKAHGERRHRSDA
jgi:hypothetical protein